MKKRLLSILLSLCMVLGLLPTVAFATDTDDADVALMDSAASTDKAIMLGASGISDPKKIENEDGTYYYKPGDYIYFGYGDNHSPIKWRVLDANKANDKKTKGMFLLSEYVISGTMFNENTSDGTQYQGSLAQSWCKSFAANEDNFSKIDQNAMLGIAKTDAAETGLYSHNWTESSLTEDDKLFFPSARELADYVGNYESAPGLQTTDSSGYGGRDWWLRSNYDHSLTSTDATVFYYRSERYENMPVYASCSTRPAFNLNPDSILFISSAVGGKSVKDMDSVLTAVGINDTNEWKLTLLDESRQFSVSTREVSSTTAGETVSVDYENAKVSTENTAEYVSAMLVDKNDNVLYYGRLKNINRSSDSSGTLKFSIPAGLDAGQYTLKLFNEQYNRDKKTDYSSAFCDVSLTVNYPYYDENETYGVGDVFSFGSYPQSKVTDATLISALEEAGKDTQWKDYNYYASTTTDSQTGGTMHVVENMMLYKDITYEGKKYRAVKINEYRPFWTGYQSNATYCFQDDNGYKTGNTYYFLYAPLSWKVLDPINGYVMCTHAIDSQAYNNFIEDNGSECYNTTYYESYATDWEGSSLRRWLNNDFYNTAFTEAEKAKICKSYLNNESTHDVGDKYDSNDTEDNIFILSFYDATNSKYGFNSKKDTADQARQFQGTDYAKCQGLCTEGGKVWWYLRTAATSKLITGVRYDGDASYGGSSYETYSTVKGIIPAFKFNPEYSITINYELDGGKWADDNYSAPTSYMSNETPTLPTADKLIRDGYTFSGWTLIEDNATSKTYKAVWSSKSAGGGASVFIRTYVVTVEDSENGSVSADQNTACSDKTVTLTVAPDKGYALETLTVLDRNGEEVELGVVAPGKKYIFKMPSGKVTVKATFMEDNTMLNYFVDVSAQDYFYDAVLWAAEGGITYGVDDSHFSPNAPCTRAQIVTFLWRAAGSPVVNYAMNLSDVSENAYYAEAVRWALSEGITDGTSDTTFSPDAACTRAQAVTFLYRAFGSPAVSGSVKFDDVADSACYADAVRWAVSEGITEGTTDTTFSPDATCTRAQIVTFLWRAYNR